MLCLSSVHVSVITFSNLPIVDSELYPKIKIRTERSLYRHNDYMYFLLQRAGYGKKVGDTQIKTKRVHAIKISNRLSTLKCFVSCYTVLA